LIVLADSSPCDLPACGCDPVQTSSIPRYLFLYAYAIPTSDIMAASIEPTIDPVLHRYTAFPNLYSTVNSRAQTDVSEVTFDLPAGVSRENVIFSWATVLRGYTGSDSVTFEVGDLQAVRVDFENDSVEDTRACTSGEDNSRYTAIYFGKVRLD
jgi:hypothetical protein